MILPQHIAIICDGNRRWAKAKHLPEFSGHKYAVETTTENLVDHCLKLNIPYLTLWFFSTENWSRGQAWVAKYFNLFRQLIPKATDKYIKKGVRLNTIGDLTKLPQDVQKFLKNWEDKSKTNHKTTLTIAFNYGGRDEILRAVNSCLQGLRGDSSQVKQGPFLKQSFEAGPYRKILEKDFEKFLDTHDLPDPDLLIRTAPNNHRLSGFMLWQIAYTQLYFTDTLFPDFTPQELDKAISWYQTQTQNLGK
ncbi:di-trans,poly-cis-decaprenylcistransferase [Patescibacteria group bacterium]|nr:di-trans,poly-cis-decaprenylcistransferase [Patescibacteria group bacterium]